LPSAEGLKLDNRVIFGSERRRESRIENERRVSMRFTTIGALVAILGTGGLSLAKDSPDEQRQKTRKMAEACLMDLYKLQPASQTAIQNSAGYAVFNNMGTNLLLLTVCMHMSPYAIAGIERSLRRAEPRSRRCDRLRMMSKPGQG
jgi:hypothetical protein